MNLTVLTNTELFRNFVENGSKEAINTFFQNQMDLFYRVAYKYTKNAADAEDVLQSAFMSIMDTAYQYKGLQSNEEKLLQSWCLSVVVHCSLMKIRTDSNRRNRETNYSNANAKPLYEDNAMEKNSENEAIHKKVQDAIVQLPEKYRIPIHLKYVEGFELDAIASILKLNGNTLRSLIKRGLEKVSTQLKEDNVTLSSVGVIGLIQGLPMEKAPFAYQTIASKMVATASNSQRILATTTSKAALFSAKMIVSLTVLCASLSAGIYFWNHFKINPVIENRGSPVSALPNMNGATLKYTNQIWDFKNEADRHLSVLQGKWEWSKSLNGMASEINSNILISLPIVPQDKAFVIEFDMVVEKNKELIEGLNISAYWLRNNIIMGHEYFIRKNKYNMTPGSIEKSFKFYYYNGYLCNFIGDECYQINKYTQSLEGASLAFASVNFIIKKISSQTFDVPPEKLLNAIKNPPTHKQVTHEDRTIEIPENKQPNNNILK